MDSSQQWLVLGSVGSGCTGLSSRGSQDRLLHSIWNLPRPHIQPMSPALAGRFLSTEPPGKSWAECFFWGHSLLNTYVLRRQSLEAWFVMWRDFSENWKEDQIAISSFFLLKPSSSHCKWIGSSEQGWWSARNWPRCHQHFFRDFPQYYHCPGLATAEHIGSGWRPYYQGFLFLGNLCYQKSSQKVVTPFT